MQTHLDPNFCHELSEEDVVEKLFDLFKPLIEEGKDFRLTWETLYEIYLIQGKYILGFAGH